LAISENHIEDEWNTCYLWGERWDVDDVRVVGGNYGGKRP
jgi:hypothetical protein